jgi:hypothetical protein
LYTTYEETANGFWDAMRVNLAQACFVDTMDKRAKVCRGLNALHCLGYAHRGLN